MSDAGKTKDAGWELGVRTTVPNDLETVWDFLLEDGLALWLGNAQLVLEKGAEYATDDEISGRILSYTPAFRIRMTWQPGEWDHDSTLQLTVKEAASGGTTIAIHQERLSGREERKIMLTHWKGVIDDLEAAIGGL
jgi:uncharacterized protein YndB with AHSA1/START domain